MANEKIKIMSEKGLDLKEENELFKDVIEEARGFSVVIHDLDQDGKIVYGNQSAADHFGLSQTELLELHSSDFDREWKENSKIVQEQLRKGNSVNLECQHKYRDREVIPVELSLHPYNYRGKNLCICYVKDITIRKQLESKTIEFERAKARESIERQFQTMVEALPDYAVFLDANMRFIYANKKVLNSMDMVFNVPSTTDWSNFKGQSVDLLYYSKTPFGKHLFEKTQSSINTCQADMFEYWIKKGALKICLDVRITPEIDAEGNCVGVLVLARDITERATLDKTLKYLASEKWKLKNHNWLDSLSQFLCDILTVDAAAIEALSGSDQLDTISSHGLKLDCNHFTRKLPGTINEQAINFASATEYKNTTQQFPNDYFVKKIKAHHALCVPLLGQKGRTIGFLSIFNIHASYHVSSAKTIMGFLSGRLSAELESSKLESIEKERETEFRSLVENSPDYISRYDKLGRCIYVNKALQNLFPDISFLELYVNKRTCSNHEIEIHRSIQEVLSSGKDTTVQYAFKLKSNKTVHCDTRIVPLFDNNGIITSVLTISRDITHRILLEEDLRRKATIDQLTNLPNRRLFTQRLSEELKNADLNKKSVALLFIDLDRFKEINDTLGHEIGDDLLMETSARLTECLPKTALELSNAILDTLAQPYALDNNLSYITASVGIARYPLDATTPAALMSCADQAMYAAKQQGRNRCCFFTSSMQEKADARVSLINDLREAQQENQFHVVYQPIIDAKSLNPVKAEALIRWNHPTRGYVSPGEFIPLAEETGLIVNIGNWVFIQTLKMVKSWRNVVGNDEFQIAINISPRHFIQDGTVDLWLSWIAEAGIPPKCISIEITENLLLGDFFEVKNELEKLRAAGVQLALDDFGTGYSAMAYLKKFNIDYLKIDGSFVRDLEHDENDRAIVESIAWMATRLGMKSVAECVETLAQKEILEKFGCDYFQGYYFSKPLTMDNFCAYLSQNKN